MTEGCVAWWRGGAPADSVVAYSTVKIVRIQDKRVGLAYYAFLLCIVGYIVGVTILYQQRYLLLQRPVGAVRVSLQSVRTRVVVLPRWCCGGVGVAGGGADWGGVGCAWGGVVAAWGGGQPQTRGQVPTAATALPYCRQAQNETHGFPNRECLYWDEQLVLYDAHTAPSSSSWRLVLLHPSPNE
jgi:hypothetical protein